MDGYRQLGDHREGCLALRHEDGIAYVMHARVEFGRDKLGRRGGSTMWHSFRCNDPRCESIMLVRWDVLARCVNAPLVEARRQGLSGSKA